MKKFLISLMGIAGLLSSDDSFLLNIENDFINGNDGYLTNSMVFSWVFGKRKGICDNWGVEIIHDTYTPRDIKSVDKTKFDAPYAGHLQSRVSFYKIQDKNFLHSVGISLGTVGRYSYAKQLQKGLHTMIGGNEPKGWDYQISSKVTASLNYDFIQNLPLKDHFGDNFDLNNHLNINYGNFSRSISIDSLIRYGNVLRDDFKSGGKAAFSQVRFNRSKGWSIFAGFTYSYMDYFYILDDFKYEYNINREKDNLALNLGFDYYTGDSEFSVYLKNSEFGMNDSYWEKQWIGVAYGYNF